MENNLHAVSQDKSKRKSQNQTANSESKTLPERINRNSESEPELKEHDRSHESSDSIETLEEPPDHDIHTEINQRFLQQLTLTHIASGSSIDSLENPAQDFLLNTQNNSDDNASCESHEVIPDQCNTTRPETLSISKQSKEQNAERLCFSYDKNKVEKFTEDCPEQVPIESLGACAIEPVTVSPHLPQGTITRKGGMIQFVADNLNEKIKQSSPLSQPDSGSFGSRRSSLHSIASASSSTSVATSSGISQSESSVIQQSPDDIPPIDSSAVIELENHASRVADSVDLMMGNIRNNLHKMSAITIGCQDAYKRSVDITCDSVDASIKAMYALMAKCEELSQSMEPVHQLAAQIKEIKRVLDLFESQVNDK